MNREKICADCRYNAFPYTFEERFIPPCMGCHDHSEHKRKINRDLLLTMTEEELADLIYYELSQFPDKASLLAWLRKEVGT